MATLSLFADRYQLSVIRDFAAQTGRDLGLDDSTLYDLQLAVDEACTNVVQHAYGGRGGEIEVTIELVDDGVRVVIRDWGAAFEPGTIPTPDVTVPLAQRSLGGLGMYLMRQLMDDVDFCFDGKNGNRLTMVKQLHGRE